MGMDVRQTKCPSRHKGGGTWVFLGGQQFKCMGKLSDWHQLWFKSADSSGNGHRLNTSRPSIPQEAFGGGGGVGCHKFKSFGKLSNGLTDWLQIWHTSGNGYTPNKLHLGGFRCQSSKVLGSCQTAGPIGTNFGSRLRINLGMEIG